MTEDRFKVLSEGKAKVIPMTDEIRKEIKEKDMNKNNMEKKIGELTKRNEDLVNAYKQNMEKMQEIQNLNQQINNEVMANSGKIQAYKEMTEDDKPVDKKKKK